MTQQFNFSELPRRGLQRHSKMFIEALFVTEGRKEGGRGEGRETEKGKK